MLPFPLGHFKNSSSQVFGQNSTRRDWERFFFFWKKKSNHKTSASKKYWSSSFLRTVYPDDNFQVAHLIFTSRANFVGWVKAWNCWFFSMFLLWTNFKLFFFRESKLIIFIFDNILRENDCVSLHTSVHIFRDISLLEFTWN